MTDAIVLCKGIEAYVTNFTRENGCNKGDSYYVMSVETTSSLIKEDHYYNVSHVWPTDIEIIYVL